MKNVSELIPYLIPLIILGLIVLGFVLDEARFIIYAYNIFLVIAVLCVVDAIYSLFKKIFKRFKK